MEPHDVYVGHEVPTTEAEFEKLAKEMCDRHALIADLGSWHTKALEEYRALRDDSLQETQSVHDFQAFLALKQRLQDLDAEMDRLRKAIETAKSEIADRRRLVAKLFWDGCILSPPVKVGAYVVQMINGSPKVTTLEDHIAATSRGKVPNWV